MRWWLDEVGRQPKIRRSPSLLERHCGPSMNPIMSTEWEMWNNIFTFNNISLKSLPIRLNKYNFFRHVFRHGCSLFTPATRKTRTLRLLCQLFHNYDNYDIWRYSQQLPADICVVIVIRVYTIIIIINTGSVSKQYHDSIFLARHNAVCFHRMWVCSAYDSGVTLNSRTTQWKTQTQNIFVSAISCYIDLSHTAWKDIHAYRISAYICQILMDIMMNNCVLYYMITLNSFHFKPRCPVRWYMIIGDKTNNENIDATWYLLTQFCPIFHVRTIPRTWGWKLS